MEISKAYTFDDVLLIPQKSTVQPSFCNTSSNISKNIKLQVPIISAAMDTVSESKLAIAMSQLGGVSCLHKNMSIKSQVDEVLKVKKYESGMVVNPITIGPKNLISDVKKWLAHSESFAKGIAYINADAEIALTGDKATSLLLVGVTKIEGHFQKGDIIAVYNKDNIEIGVGQTQYDSEIAVKNIGKKEIKPLIQYDYLYLNNI